MPVESLSRYPTRFVPRGLTSALFLEFQEAVVVKEPCIVRPVKELSGSTLLGNYHRKSIEHRKHLAAFT
jgi:hypothetical protein